jgi:nitroreductase
MFESKPFEEVVRRRRMVRSFEDRPVEREVVDGMLDLARRAPSAGYSQGTEFLVLDRPEDRDRYWSISFAGEDERERFRWQGLFRAPVLVLPMSNERAYLDRYSEPDKAPAGLQEADAWPVPYWDVDAGMATMVLLLAAVDAGLGALFFGIFGGEPELLQAFGVPAEYRPIGTVAIGHPAEGGPTGSSATRQRRPFDEVVHRGGW